MTLQKLLQRIARRIADTPVIGTALRAAIPNLHLSHRWKHPFDKAHGIEANGYIDQRRLTIDKDFNEKINGYMGVQPSVVRQALNTLPDLKEYSFVDLGCGKGRALVVASEFPFRHISGVEISSKIARIAQKNALIIKNRYPSRTKVEIIKGNAVDFPRSNRKIVLFNYNAFGTELMTQLLKNIERGLEQSIEHLFLIYHNPRCGVLPDSSPAMMRWYAGQFSCDPSEQNFGPRIENPTVIWQSVKGAYPLRHAGADRMILLTGVQSTALGNTISEGQTPSLIVSK